MNTYIPCSLVLQKRKTPLHDIVSSCCPRFDQLQSLGKKVSSSASSQGMGEKIAERMRQLTTERANLKESWERRNKQLKQCSDLQVFLRDAEMVDSATGAQEAFLADDNLGVRVCVHV